MKLNKKLAPLAAAAVAATIFATPTVHAEVNASIGVSNMYLWRGQNISPNGGVVRGDLVWSGTSGLYGGMWTSSEDSGQEWDLFFGYAGKAGPVDFDVSYVNYSYPQNTKMDLAADATGNTTVKAGLSESDYNEIVASVGTGPISAKIYYDIDSDRNNYWYFTMTYAWSKYALTYGTWNHNGGTVKTASANPVDLGTDQYSNLTLNYAATDDLTVSLNKAFSDLPHGDAAAVEESLLIAISYGWSFDVKK